MVESVLNMALGVLYALAFSVQHPTLPISAGEVSRSLVSPFFAADCSSSFLLTLPQYSAVRLADRKEGDGMDGVRNDSSEMSWNLIWHQIV